MKILTAIGNPAIHFELKKKGYFVINTDIQYKEGVLEYLDSNPVDCIILWDKLEGEISLKKLIYQIKSQIKNILVILEEDKWISFLEKEKIKYIKKDKDFNIENIVHYLEKINHRKILGIKKENEKKNKIREKLIKNYKKEKKNYYNTNHKKIIGIISLFSFEYKKNYPEIAQNIMIKIIRKENKKIIIEINHKKIILNSKTDLMKKIIFLNLQKRKEKNIYILINKKELIYDIIFYKKINKIIWILNTEINTLIESKKILKEIRANLLNTEILFLYHPWKGVDPDVAKNIFQEYKKIKIIGGK